MSSEPSTDEPLLAELKTVREKYRRKRLDKKLTSIAELMEETILQAELANQLFDGRLSIDSDAKSDVRELKSLLEADDFDGLEDQIDEVEETVQAENQRISAEISEALVERKKIVQAMQRLNERVDRYDQDKLEELYALFSEWNWQATLSTKEAETFAERRSAIQQFGQTRAEWLTEAKDELFEPYRETEMWEILHPILNQERLTYGELTDSQRTELANSELADYLELQLS